MGIKIIARADDAGSSHSANGAIAHALQMGFTKNVSLMAVGDYIGEAAAIMKDAKHICFGMHATLNAEWDKVKWGPVTKLTPESGLVDENGYFLPTPSLFQDTKPDAAVALREYDAQLDRLTRLGFAIVYVDSHMFEEHFIEGLAEAKKDWAARKGLLSHTKFRGVSSRISFHDSYDEIIAGFAALGEGTYVHVTHPAMYGEDMLMTGTARQTGEQVARERSREAAVVGDPAFARRFQEAGMVTVRYDEA